MSRKRKKEEATFTLIAAISLDGRITRGTEEGSGWTSKEDKYWFQKELARFDAVVMGRKTFDTITRPLTPRNRVIFTRTPFVIPVRRGGGIQKTFLFSGSARKLMTLLEERGWARIAVLGGTEIYDWFLKRNFISEMYLTLEPVIFGSGKMLSSQMKSPCSQFRLLSIKKLNSQGTLLLHYNNKKTES